ncbi:hypothetical protein [Salinispora cortesiana]|uniref:hypothetical protein n=1 Tax=Salinispora cortesiana TaxID=1305843 RepID=UPI000470F24A|nr:hypothetical protein [Salinispora cortesiana]
MMRKHYRLAIASLGMGIAEFGDVAYVVSLAASLYLSGSRSAIYVSLAMAAYGGEVWPDRGWVARWSTCCPRVAGFTGDLLGGSLVNTLSGKALLSPFARFAWTTETADRR